MILQHTEIEVGVAVLNYFQLITNGTLVVFKWNLQGLLIRIDLCEKTSSAAPLGYLVNTRKIPASLRELFEKVSFYFEKGEPIQEIPWDLFHQEGWSSFQKKVYQITTSIPHGETRTYAWVAQKIGNPAAVRAVGQALKKNPFPILIPCHRVVSSQGMGGFMGKVDPDEPELQLKKDLITLEESYQSPVFSFLAVGAHP